MEQQFNKSVSVAPQLTDDDQTKIVNFVRNMWQKGMDARKPYEAQWKEDEKAYLCEHSNVIDKRLEWRSRVYLPWSYEAIESWYAYMSQSLIPRDDQMFVIMGRTPEDDESADVMTKYLTYSHDRMGFAERFGEGVLKPAGIKGHACVKVYWRTDSVKHYDVEEVPDENGNPVRMRVEKEQNSYNGVWFDPVDIDDFVFYPIYGDMSKTTQIHQTYRFKEELLSQYEAGYPYFNMDKLHLLEENNSYYDRDKNEVVQYEQKEGTQKAGYNIKEAWIWRCKIGDRVFHNMVATIVDDKLLIRFQPNPYPMGKTPFVFTSLISHGFCNYGFGLLSKTLPLQKAANFSFNAIIDETKLKVYRPYKYWDDGVFNPYNVVARPAAFIEFQDAESVATNMVPLIDDFGNLQIGYQEISQLKAEFENATIPKVVKGLIEQQDTTATEVNYSHQNAAGKQHVQAQRINEKIIKPMLELEYLLISQKAKDDPEVLLDIARVTQEHIETTEVPMDPMNPDAGMREEVGVKTDQQLIQSLPPLLPLPEMDIKIVGYQNQIQRRETLASLQGSLQQIAQTPAANTVDWSEAIEYGLQLGLVDPDRILLPKDERKKAMDNQQRQQQEMMAQKMAQEKAQIDLQVLKEHNHYDIEMKKLELEAFKLGVQEAKQNIVNDIAGYSGPEGPGNTPPSAEAA